MKQLTVLVCPINAVGHVNSCLGTVSAFVKGGHKVVFVVEAAWSGKLAPKFGVIEHLYSAPMQTGKQTADILAKIFLDMGLIGPQSPKEKSINCLKFLQSPHLQEEWTFYNGAIKTAIEQYKPDVIITDENGVMPAIIYSKIPWIRNVSCNPLFFEQEDDIPPGGSGLPLDDRSGWADFNEVRKEYIHSAQFNDFVQSLGYDRYPNDIKTPRTAAMTVYACPEEWNYPAFREKTDWFNLEVFNKKAPKNVPDLEMLLPESFINENLNNRFSGKYVYVSLGSMGSVDLELMKRLLSALADTPHKYIVSKGPLHDQYEVAGANQWGDRYLPQLDIIPHVDLVITHGGNNSITEIFAHGKPTIVLPLFADQ